MYTIRNIIPKEIPFLSNDDSFKKFMEEEFEMPDRMISMLVRFLEQNNGVLSKSAKDKEFSNLSEKEVGRIEEEYKAIFGFS